MRVVAGEFRSRLLQAPAGQSTRPTSDKLRETLFNVLGSRVPGARFADLFAGSGAVGIEALSRGAAFSYFAERSPAALRALRANLAALDLAGSTAVNERGVAPLLRKLAADHAAPLDLVFLDPPYDAEADYLATLGTLGRERLALLGPAATVIAEHARRHPLPASIPGLTRTRVLEQGDAALSFFSPTSPAGPL